MDIGINQLFDPARHKPKLEFDFKRVVLTSGPGCGKTSLAVGLEYLGYEVLREAAADYILFRKAQGSICPWKESNFQDEISLASIKREQQRFAIAPWHFQDRSVLDCYAFYRFRGRDPAPLVTKALSQIDLKSRYFRKVFLLEDIGEVEHGGLRIESFEESRQISLILEDVYQEFGYEVVRVPSAPLSDRVQWVISYLKSTS